ncbi:MAG TPA: Ig-like domain-containing protein, partial [Fimbriimonadaceae bacterium]|nr:Ig-like domain-containing protein [Fimbriimonadaceae bacterium]
ASLCAFASAQTIIPFQHAWQRVHDGGNEDAVHDATVDNLGNCYVLGVSHPTSTSANGAKILKYSPSGALVWSKNFLPSGYSLAVARKAVVTFNRELYVAGYAQVGTDVSKRDLFIVKYNEAGEEHWRRIYNGPADGPDEANALVMDGSFNLYIGGRSAGSSADNLDMVVISYDRFGAHRWTYRKDGPSAISDNVNGLALSGDRLLVGGHLDLAPAVANLNQTTGEEAWFRKIPVSGFSIRGSSSTTGIGIDSAGNAYLAGTVASATRAGAYRFFALKCAPSGTVPWIRTYYEGLETSLATAMAVDREGNLYVAGQCTRPGTGVDMLTVKYDSAGARAWARPLTYVGEREDRVRSLTLDQYGRLYAFAEMSPDEGLPPTSYLVAYSPSGVSEIFQPQNRSTDKPRSLAMAIAVSTEGNIFTARNNYPSGDIILDKYIQAPICADDSFDLLDNSTLIRDVFANDRFTDGAVAVLVSGPSHGTVELNTNGTFTYTPPTDFAGTTSFTYYGRREGIRSPTQTVALNVWPRLIGVTVNPSSVKGGRSATGRVSLSRAHPSQAVLVQLSSGNPAVTVPTAVSVPAGAATADFNVLTSGVSAPLAVTIAATRMAITRTTTLTVEQAVLERVVLTPAEAYSGNTVQATVSLIGSAPAGGRTVSLNSSNPALASVPSTLAISSGASQAVATISTSPVTSVQTVTISATLDGLTRTADLALRPTRVKSVTFAPNPVVGGRSTVGTVQLESPAPSSGFTITLTSPSSAISTPSSVAVPAGARSANFTATTTPVSAVTTRPVYAQDPPGFTVHGFLSLVPTELRSLTLTPNEVIGGRSTTGTVALYGTSSSPRTVTLASGSSAISVPPSVTLPPGASELTFSVNTSPVSSDATRYVSATYDGATRSAALTLRVGPSLVSLGISPSSVRGGSSATGTVTLSSAPPP